MSIFKTSEANMSLNIDASFNGGATKTFSNKLRIGGANTCLNEHTHKWVERDFKSDKNVKEQSKKNDIEVD
jgi:hypothetical protein